MKLSDMLGRWRKRRQSEAAEREGEERRPEAEAQAGSVASPPPGIVGEDGAAPASPGGTMGSAQPSPPEIAGGDEEKIEGLDDVVQTVQTIQQLLGERVEEEGGQQFIEIPVDALVERIPEEVRGPGWETIRNAADQHRLVVDRDTLIEQLKQGRIVLPIRVFSGQLPPGVLADGVDPDLEVELDLPRVVSSVPPELLVPEEQMEEEMALGEDLFAPKTVLASEEEAAAVMSPTPDEEGEGASEISAGRAVRAAPAEEPVQVEEEREETPVEKAGEMAAAVSAEPEGREEREPAAAATGFPEAPEHADREAEPAAAVEEKGAESAERIGAVLEEQEAGVSAVAEETAEAAAEESAAGVAAAEPGIEPESILPPPEALVSTTSAVEEEPVSEPSGIATPDLLPAEAAWDGVESALEAPAGVDINSAGEEELTAVRGCGPVRAATIVRYREEHGPFRSIFDLLQVPGIGPITFARMTGLSPRRRENRHQVLARLLRFDEEPVVPLAVIPQRLAGQFDALGAVVGNVEGLALGAYGNLTEEADAFTAWAVQFFRRTRRYLTPLGIEQDAQVVFLPTATPSLLLGFQGDVLVVLAIRSSGLRREYSKRLVTILQELEWRFRRRAVVRSL